MTFRGPRQEAANSPTEGSPSAPPCGLRLGPRKITSRLPRLSVPDNEQTRKRLLRRSCVERGCDDHAPLAAVPGRLAIAQLTPCEHRAANVQARHASPSQCSRHFDLAASQSPKVLGPLRVAHWKSKPEHRDRIASRAARSVGLLQQRPRQHQMIQAGRKLLGERQPSRTIVPRQPASPPAHRAHVPISRLLGSRGTRRAIRIPNRASTSPDRPGPRELATADCLLYVAALMGYLRAGNWIDSSGKPGGQPGRDLHREDRGRPSSLLQAS